MDKSSVLPVFQLNKSAAAGLFYEQQRVGSHSKDTIMQPHSQQTLERMLPEAEKAVARGEELIRTQEARIACFRDQGALAAQSKKLLGIMKQTQELQIQHVALLRRELEGELAGSH